MIPKVFEVAKNESNVGLKVLYEECLTCTTQGAVHTIGIAGYCT